MKRYHTCFGCRVSYAFFRGEYADRDNSYALIRLPYGRQSKLRSIGLEQCHLSQRKAIGTGIKANRRKTNPTILPVLSQASRPRAIRNRSTVNASKMQPLATPPRLVRFVFLTNMSLMNSSFYRFLVL